VNLFFNFLFFFDIFSSFDSRIFNPQRNSLPVIIWVRFFLSLFSFYTNIIWISFSQILVNFFFFIGCIFNYHKIFLSENRNIYNIKGLLSLISSIFFRLLFANFTGLIPYFFRYRRQVFFVFTLALPVWGFLIVSSLFTNIKRFSAKFLPEGAPWFLNPFLGIVEFIRVLVRPLTLSIRLVANINAGHLVLILCRSYCHQGFSINLFETFFQLGPILLGFINGFYLLFELFICLIQIYIFSILLILYTEEHTHSISGLFFLK